MAIPVTVLAGEEVTIDGIKYDLVTKAKQATVIAGDEKYTGDVVIPATVTYNNVIYNVTSIGYQAFYYCSGLTSIDIPSSVTSIGSSAFYYCSGLTSIDIPNSVSNIGDFVFCCCSGLTSVIIPNSVTAIGENAFHGCSGLTSIDIPNSVTSIGGGAFRYCSGLTSITIGNGVTSIGGFWAFDRCDGLTSVHISDIAAWCNISFNHYSSNPLNYAHHLYLNDQEITDLVIPEGVTSIGQLAFLSCSGLTSVTIPNSVTSIGGGAFDGCSGLTSITIPNSVTSIGEGAFGYCHGLTSVTIPNSVTSIGEKVFFDCFSLTSVDIGSRVRTIGSYAFANCEVLEVVTCHATSVPTTQSNAFDNSYVEYAKLIVPDEAYDAYSTTAPWSNFGTKLKLSEATVVSANSYTREYGEPNPEFGYTSGTILNGTPEITCAATKTSAPGIYPITISQGTVTNTGLVFVDGTLTITKAPLTVTAQSYTITEGDDLPTFEVECTGLKNGETEEVLNPVINCTASNSNTTGVYPITVTVTTDNYEVTNEAGTLTIVPTEAVINISSAGMATYCSPYDLDFSGVKNLKAYIISGYDWANKKVFATRVYDVPAGTGLYLVAPEGEYHVNIGSTSCYYINMLVGTTSSITLEPTDGDVTNLILTGTSPQNASFKTLAASRTFGVNKAYLQIPTSVLSSSANAVGIIFDDETDGIESISGMGHANGDWFTLDGRKLNSRPAQKGVYILNGNKIVIK